MPMTRAVEISRVSTFSISAFALAAFTCISSDCAAATRANAEIASSSFISVPLLFRKTDGPDGSGMTLGIDDDIGFHATFERDSHHDSGIDGLIIERHEILWRRRPGLAAMVHSRPRVRTFHLRRIHGVRGLYDRRGCGSTMHGSHRRFMRRQQCE